MLRIAFERLEGGNILWHIVGPPPPSHPFSLSFLLFCTRFGLACLFGWMFDSTRRSRGMAIKHVWALSFKQHNGGCGIITPLYVIIFLKKGCVWGISLYEKLWDHLRKREKLDLGSTKQDSLSLTKLIGRNLRISKKNYLERQCI